VFARTQLISHRLLVRFSPLVVLVLVIAMLTQATEPIWALVPLHLVTFFVIALVCHGQLAAERPGVAHLTEFYLWLAVGGVLGGLFNALVAPLIFPAVVEYPLILVLACILRPGFEYPPERRAQQVKVQKRRNEARQLVGARAPDRVGKAIGPQRTDGSDETASIQYAP